MKRISLLLLSALLCTPALASESRSSIEGLVKDLRTLQEQGRQQASRHDLTDPAQQALCMKESEAARQQARAIQDRSARFSSLPARIQLTLSAAATIKCLSCSNDTESCDNGAQLLDRYSAQFLQPKDDDKAAPASP